jgi:hypothetical protein
MLFWQGQPKVGGNIIRKKEERLWDFRTVQGVEHAQNGTVRRSWMVANLFHDSEDG